MFSVWQRPQIVWGGGDEAGSGGEGSKGRSKNEMKTQRKINTQLKESGGKFTPEINDLVAQRERDRAATARNTAGTKYTGLKDMFDGGGPGASGPQFRGGPFSGVTNPFAGGGGGSGSTPTPAPRQRIGTKGMTSAQRKALTDAGYEVTKGGSVKKNGGTVAGSNFSGSREVDAIMNSGPLSGERGSFGDAFAAARKKAGGDGGTFTFGGETFTTNIDTAPKTSLRPKLRPTTTTPAAPAAAPIVDYDSLYQDAAYGPGGIGAAPFGSYAPTPTPRAPSSFDLDRALSTPFNVDDNIYRQGSKPELMDYYEDAGFSDDERRQIARSIPKRGGVGSGSAPSSVLGPDYPISTSAAFLASPELGIDRLQEPAYTTSFDDQSAAESFGDRQRRRELAGDPTAFTGFNYPVASLDDPPPVIDTIPDLGSDPSDNREPRGMYDSPSIVLPDELIGAPMGYVPEPMTYREILEGADAEIIPEARTAPLSDYDAAQALLTGDAGGRLKPGFSQPLQARIDTPEEDAIERARLQARVGAGIGTISPEVERNAASNVRLQNLRRYVNQQRDPEPPGLSTAELLAAGAAQGASIMSRAAQDATNVIAPPDMLDDGADFVGPFRPGMEPKAGVPMVVGQQSKVATEAAIAAEGASNVFDRVIRNMDEKTQDAVTRRIFPDGIGSFDSEAAKAQFVMQGASMFPIVAAMVANPKLGMTVAGGATIADVGQQIDANVDARYKAGELGRLNPSQVQAIKLLAREKAAVPSAVVGGTVARFLGTNPISGIVADVISEVGLEPTIAETTTALASNTAIKPEEFVADRAGDVALLSAGTSGLIAPAAVAGQAMNTASAPPVVQTEAPTQDSLAYKAGQGLGSFTPPKAFSDAATLTATTMGGTPKMPSAVAPDAAAKVISGSGSSVAPAPVVETKAPVQTLPENLSGLGQQGGIPSLLASSSLTPGVRLPALSANNQVQGTLPTVQGFVPGDKAKIQAATIEDTGTGVTVDAPTPLTPEQIANVSPEAALELDAALDVAPTTAVDAAPTQIDKNGLSRPENVSAAIDLLKTQGKNSASFLQRKLRINYSEAAEINKQLEAEGYISAPDKIGRRKILTTDPTTAAEELISETAPTVNLADVAANKNTALQGAAAEIDNTLGTTDNMRHDEMIGSSGGLTGSQIYGNVVRALQGKDTVTRVEIMEMTPTMSDGVAGKVLDQLKDMGGVIGGKDANGVFRVSQSAVAKEIGVPYENPNKIVMRTPKPDSSVGAMDNRLRSALTQELLRRDPNTDAPFNEFFYDQLNQKLKDTDQNLSALPPDPRALELAQLNRAGPLQTGGVPRTYPTTGIDSLSPLANQLYTPEQRANMQRDRQISNAQREKARLEAEAMAPLNRAQAALDAVVDPVPAAIQSVEAQRAEMLAANKTYQDYINTRAQISALDGVTKEQAEREAFAAVEQRIEDQQQRLLNAVNAEGGTAAITNAANNEIAKLEAQLNAVKEVILNGKTPFPVNLPATPEFTTPQTKAQLAAITTPVEVAEMSPLVGASTESAPTEVDPTLGVAQQLRQDDLIDALAEAQQAPVDPPPVADPSTEAIMKGVMSLVKQTDARSKVPDQQPLVLTDPVEAQAITDASGGITTALPGRIPKDKLTTRFDSNLPVDSPFSLENQLARYAERRAKAAVKDKTAPVVSTKDPILKAAEEISKENQIEQDRINARNAALRGLASIPATRTTIMDEPRDLIEEQTLPDELLTEPFNNTPPEDTGGEGEGTGTPRESAPKYVPVDMNNENNDDLGCPSGYARVFDPATGQPICGRIDEPSAPGPAAPAEEAEEEEDGVVIDIPIVERPKISPYYVPEMVESNYTPYVPGRRARTQ
jgi:hypothetical protein